MHLVKASLDAGRIGCLVLSMFRLYEGSERRFQRRGIVVVENMKASQGRGWPDPRQATRANKMTDVVKEEWDATFIDRF